MNSKKFPEKYLNAVSNAKQEKQDRATQK